jgi:hypothetical protein
MKAPEAAVEGKDPDNGNGAIGDVFIRQVEDHSLLAAQVLILQMEGRERELPMHVFVP